jgi:predicted ABC-type ATPase
MPVLYIIAGPNGAGKTTLAGKLLKQFDVTEFVNADNIAKGLSPFNPASVDIQAGRLMLQRINHLLELKIDFAIETTLSSKMYEKLSERIKREGYSIVLFFVWLEDFHLAQKRVSERVKRGGHNIPPEVIQRRYYRGLENLNRYYLPIVDYWILFDNSNQIPEKLAEGEKGVVRKVYNSDICNKIIHLNNE